MTEQASSFLSFKCAIAPSPDKGGKCICAQAPIGRGELIAIWTGRLVCTKRLADLSAEFRRRTVQIETGLYLTSFSLDEPADYINHSCEPNAGMSGQVGVVALRPIVPDEEITLDYAMCDGSAYDEFDCHCGAAGCRRRITGEDWRNPVLWARYRGNFSPYLQRRIDRLNRGAGRLRRAANRRMVLAV